MEEKIIDVDNSNWIELSAPKPIITTTENPNIVIETITIENQIDISFKLAEKETLELRIAEMESKIINLQSELSNLPDTIKDIVNNEIANLMLIVEMDKVDLGTINEFLSQLV